MRQLRKNKQKMYYALFSENVTEYATDSDGNIIYTQIDGQQIPVKAGTRQGYTDAVQFKANIGVNSGETKMAEYGLNAGDYNAVISANKGELPLTEQTLIWHKSPVEYDDKGHVKPESADYRVIAIKTSLNEERFILKKRNGNGTDESSTPSA